MNPELYATIWGSMWLILAILTLTLAAFVMVCFWTINQAFSGNGGQSWSTELERYAKPSRLERTYASGLVARSVSASSAIEQ